MPDLRPPFHGSAESRAPRSLGNLGNLGPPSWPAALLNQPCRDDGSAPRSDFDEPSRSFSFADVPC